MRSVLVDLYKIKTPASGLGQFSLNFHEALTNCFPEDLEITFLTPGSLTPSKKPGYHYEPVSLQKRYFPQVGKRYDIWHSLHQFPSHLPGKSSRFILTVHDLNFLAEKSEKKLVKYLERLQKNVDRADVITTISHYTRSKMEENLNLKGKEIQTIYNGVKLKTFTGVPRPDFVKKENFFFSIGIFSAKKNFEVLLPLMREFTDHQLIIAGDCNTPYGKHIRSQIKTLGLTDTVVLPDRVSDEEKYWLYTNCRAFLFPSLAEGFGLPVIEAMSAGKPVFLSSFTSLPEIGGTHAFYWESLYPEHMLKVLEQELTHFYQDEKEKAQQLRSYARKFDWEHCIKQYMELYHQLF